MPRYSLKGFYKQKNTLNAIYLSQLSCMVNALKKNTGIDAQLHCNLNTFKFVVTLKLVKKEEAKIVEIYSIC
jgi:hypothetical protein